MTSRWTRVVRGLVAALVSTFVALCSHALAGGQLPGFAGLALCLAFATLVCVFLAGRSLSLPRLSVAVAVSQLAFHCAFSMLSDAAATVTPKQPMSHGMMPTTPLHLVAGHTAAMGPEPRMWAGHAAAFVLTVVALRFGERSVRGLLTAGRFVLVRLIPSITPVTPFSAIANGVAIERAALPRSVRDIRSVLAHRGPPISAAQY